MDKGGPGEKERKEVHLGEKLFTFPRTQTQIHKRNMQIQIHKYNCTNTNTKIQIQKYIYQVRRRWGGRKFISERSFSRFPVIGSVVFKITLRSTGLASFDCSVLEKLFWSINIAYLI